MATQVEKDGCLEITEIAADWDYKTSKPGNWPDRPRLNSIEYHPGGADTIVIKQSTDAGPVRFYAETEDTKDSRIKYFNGARVDPYVDFGDCTLNSGHKLVIELWRSP